MLFQEATPDTSGYMIAGYVITFVIMGLYVASIYLRSRNLKQDMTVLQELDTPAPAVERKKTAKPFVSTTPKPVTKQRAKK
jgi:hypothetical protein